MSDFAQPGLITTLQRLNNSHLNAIEGELEELASARPIALVLPCHAAELDRPALQHLIKELSAVKWLREILVSMNGRNPADRLRAESLFGTLPQPVRVLWHTDASAGTSGGTSVAPMRTGKGENVNSAFRMLVQEGKAEIVVTQDCDVMSFRRQDLARLCYAVAHPEMGFQFAKAYYSRATDRLYGRVTRLFLDPLLHACVRVAGHQPLLTFLQSFRYPLAGEMAMSLKLAGALPIAAGWGLEIATLCELFRHVDPRSVCQVDGGSGYDHKHQPNEAVAGKMAREIALELFRQMEMEFPCGPEFPALVAAAYLREGEQAVRRSAALARINGLPFDETGERELMAKFASVIPGNPGTTEPGRVLPKRGIPPGEFERPSEPPKSVL